MHIKLLIATAAAALLVTACSQAENAASDAASEAAKMAEGAMHSATDMAHDALGGIASISESAGFGQSVKLNVITNDRSTLGTVTFTQHEKLVSAHVIISGLTPGKHGVHFHSVGDCSDDKFLNTKSHINPMGHMHGLEHPEGPDNGDFVNLVADSTGHVNQVITSTLVSFNGNGDMQPALYDNDGSALVIHADPDDQVTQPIGGAGARIGCAAINK